MAKHELPISSEQIRELGPNPLEGDDLPEVS